MVKNLLAMQEAQLNPWMGKIPGEGNDYHCSILAWRIPWTEEPGGIWGPWGHEELNLTE